MEMDAPPCLNTFNGQLREHFSRFPRFSARVTKRGDSYELEQVSDPELLEKQFRVHGEGLDFAGMQQLVSEEVTRGITFDETRIRFVTIPQKGETGRVYVLGIFDHGVTDGLSILQCVSMLQENWQENPLPW